MRNVNLVSVVVTLVTAIDWNDSIKSLVASSLLHVVIVSNIQFPALLLWSKEGENDDVGVDTSHEDADDLSVLVALGLAFWWERESLADGGLDGGGGGRNQVTELVRGTDDESSERSWRQFHEMNWNDSPSTLHTELLEECGGNDSFAGGKGVRVEKSTTDDTNDDDAKAAAKGL